MANLNYYLLAEQLVPENETNFDDELKLFIARNGFQRLAPDFDNELTLALKSSKPVPFESFSRLDLPQSQLTRSATDTRLQQGHLVYHYLHLWKVRDKRDLALGEVMLRCADDDLYSRINSRVVREIQNFVIDVKWLRFERESVESSGEVFVVSRRFRSVDLGRFLSVVGTLFHSIRQQGWRLVGYYQNVTGPLNSVTELWQRVRPAVGKGSVRFAETPRAAFETSLHTLPVRFRKFADEVQYESSLSFTLAPYFLPRRRPEHQYSTVN